jgi:hypothetical protein
MGTVISWCKANRSDEESKGDQWSTALDRGGETDLSALEVVDGVLRARKWALLHENYVEVDAPFLFYRNKLRKFCGKASEALFSATAHAFSRLMVKREAELYIQIKNRSYIKIIGVVKLELETSGFNLCVILLMILIVCITDS